MRIRWLFPFASVQRLPDIHGVSSTHLSAEQIPLIGASFRDRAKSVEWVQVACSLLHVYQHPVLGAATTVGRLMDHMSCLLPFAYSDAVQRVLLHPFVRGVIDVPGHYVYCLLSPLMRKVYVGAVGLKSARTPYARLREHLNLARLWNNNKNPIQENTGLEDPVGLKK